MKCPNCGLINSDSALHCDCGFSFEPGELDAKTRKGRKRNRRSKLSAFELFALVVWFVVAPGLYYSRGEVFEVGAFWFWIAGALLLIWCMVRSRGNRRR